MSAYDLEERVTWSPTMAQGPYNPQEVLSPLMRRLGRRLPGSLGDGYQRMIRVVSEEVRVDLTHAAKLLDGLRNSGLLAYESPGRPSSGEFSSWQSRPNPDADPARLADSSGAWRIGPCI